MDGKVGSVVVSVGAGALATVIGLFVIRKMKKYLRKKTEMQMSNKQLHLSTRCTWLISELGVEDDFEEEAGCLHYPSEEDLCRLPGLPMLTHAERVQSMFSDFPESELPRSDSEMSLVRWKTGDPFPDDVSDNSLCLSDSASASSLSARIPAVITNDEFSMIEGAAICMYLADLYGNFLPDPQHKAEYYSWIVYSATTFDSILRTLQLEMVDTPEARQDETLIESALQGFHAFARALSDTLDTRDYLCGESFTAADCVIGFTLWWAYTIDNGRLLDQYPVLSDYLDRLRERPAFQKTFCKEGDEWSWAKYFTTTVRGITQ